MNINDLLDEARIRGGFPSDAKLAGELGCASNVVLVNWRKGKGQPDLYAIWRLGELTGRDVMEIMAIIEAERDKRPEVKAFFEKILESGSYKKVLVGATAMGMLMSPFGSGDVAASQVNTKHGTSLAAELVKASNVYYVKL